MAGTRQRVMARALTLFCLLALTACDPGGAPASVDSQQTAPATGVTVSGSARVGVVY